MNYFDTLYRALADYRKNTSNQTECKVQRAAILAADSDKDRIEITRKNCVVETDWIEMIESKLEFIEKAIKEERQFIRTNGEVEPIEKVKRVSKDSVEHLARHSNYFTREPEEGEDMIPDQLYVVERLSDYAVYENRFLYMLLCYLRDFIGMRYEKILELTNTYVGNMSMEKDVVEINRKVKVHVRLEEERKNDEYLREHNMAQRELDRMRILHQAVIAFLKTPLMVEVAKTPMIKPPITRTNVLKMNRNFREALGLYEYVSAYNHDGYTIHTEKNALTPFVGTAGEEIADVLDVSLFLTYEYGLGIRDYFRERYDAEEDRRRTEESQKLAERIRNIERHLSNEGLTPSEYIRLLEERIHDLEREEEELAQAKKELEHVDMALQETHAELERAKETARVLGDEITRLGAQFALDMEEAQATHKANMAELAEKHKAEIAHLNDAHENEIYELKEEEQRIREGHRQELAKEREEYEQKVEALSEEFANEASALRGEIAGGEKALASLQEKYTALEERRMLADARLNALRKEHGLITDAEDFTSKEAIDELEREYETFQKFFKKEWRKTRWKMIKELFGNLFGKKAREKDRIEKEEREQAKLLAEQSGESVDEKGFKAWVAKQWDKTKTTSKKLFDKAKGWFAKKETKETDTKVEETAKTEEAENALGEVAVSEAIEDGTKNLESVSQERINNDEDEA
ncbi:MAG: DUF2357 domain-containing protein [Clostridiales bacterium]|nr:DUF2357 domain-containing protein [Clostridiales bacterium]